MTKNVLFQLSFLVHGLSITETVNQFTPFSDYFHNLLTNHQQEIYNLSKINEEKMNKLFDQQSKVYNQKEYYCVSSFWNSISAVLKQTGTDLDSAKICLDDSKLHSDILGEKIKANKDACLKNGQKYKHRENKTMFDLIYNTLNVEHFFIAQVNKNCTKKLEVSEIEKCLVKFYISYNPKIKFLSIIVNRGIKRMSAHVDDLEAYLTNCLTDLDELSSQYQEKYKYMFIDCVNKIKKK